MFDPTQAGIDAATFAIGLITTVGVLKADLRNLKGWVKRIDEKLDSTNDLTQELKGRVEVLTLNRSTR